MKQTIFVIICILLLTGCVNDGASKHSNAIEDATCSDNNNSHTEKEVACPFGIHEEEYPGTCFRYADDNNNNICDLSE